MSEAPEMLTIHAAQLADADGRVWARKVAIRIPKGAKVGVITTPAAAGQALLRLIAASGPAQSVAASWMPAPIAPDATVWTQIGEGVADLKAALDRFDWITRDKIHPIDDDLHYWLDEQQKLQKRLNAAGAWDLDVRMKDAILGLRCPPAPTVLDGVGDTARRRVDLARQLVAAADLLLLDDPSAELDADSSVWLEQNLRRQPGTVVFASADRALLHGVASHIIAVEDGRCTTIAGGYGDYLTHRADLAAADGAATQARKRAIEDEIAWIRNGAPARRAETVPGASVLQRFLAKRASSDETPVELAIAPGPRLGDEVIAVAGLHKTAGERVLIHNLSFRLPPGAVVGVLGPPGIGKSTLLRIIAGREAPDDGALRADDAVVLAHPDLARLQPNPDAPVVDDVGGGHSELELAERTIAVRDFLAALDFTAGEMAAPCGTLDDAGRRRLLLAKTLLAGANVLVLDEPLRGLSLNAQRALEDALIDFVGCAVVATNDRWFLNRVATHLLGFEGDSQVTWFTGNFDAYAAHRVARRGPGALKGGWPRFKLAAPNPTESAPAS